MKKAYDQNAVRRGVSLIVPLILEAITSGKKKGLTDYIQQYLPRYKLSGVDSLAIEQYFTPVNLKDTGKRRLYVNSNGYFIRYLTRKNLRAIFADLRTQIPKANETSFYACFSNRWVIIRGSGHHSLSGWDNFIDSIAFIEAKASKDNHPPCGFGKYTCIDDILDKYKNIYDFRPDFMRPGTRSISVRLDKYELGLPEFGDVNHDKSV